MSTEYKRELIISTRTDVRLIAGLALFYKDKNMLARTKSSLIGDSLEDFVLFLANKNLTSIPETVAEALQILKENNFNFFVKEGKALQRNIVKVLADEEYDIVRAEVEAIDIDMAKAVANKLS